MKKFYEWKSWPSMKRREREKNVDDDDDDDDEDDDEDDEVMIMLRFDNNRIHVSIERWMVERSFPFILTLNLLNEDHEWAAAHSMCISDIWETIVVVSIHGQTLSVWKEKRCLDLLKKAGKRRGLASLPCPLGDRCHI